MTTTRMTGEPRCPECGVLVDRATDVSGEGARPSPGDVTVCVYCAAVLTFGEHLELASASDDVVRSLPLKVLLAVCFMRAEIAAGRGPKPDRNVDRGAS